MQKIILGLIKVYQKTLSRDMGWLSVVYSGKTCRFHPTCSQYTYEAIEKFGVLKGGYLGLRRILKCHPWSKGGIDKVPD
ncbi:MAG: membrane protein insertion efficiency factor YidD [Candidatus Moranbacteria bacterium]|nr:membrane protein insertion efficiency factor YidD [Candidatus Moranbacteria bacterium]